MCGSKSCIITGAMLITLGLIVGIGWLFGCIPLIHSQADKQLRKQLVIDSPYAIGYDDWVYGISTRNWNYYVYSFWNLTNPDDVLGGAKPEFEEVGPFYYRYYWYNTNATFSENGNKAEYSLLEDYIYQPDKSISDPSQTYITNINPAYLGLLSQAGGEGQVAGAAVRIWMIKFLDFLTGPYLEIVTSQYVPQQLTQNQQSIIQQISQANSSINAEDYFYWAWANATETPDITADWKGMLISASVGTPSNLPLDTVRALFNDSASLSLLDASADGVMTWYKAALNESGDEANQLSELFMISMEQVKMIADWRTDVFEPTYVGELLQNIAQQNYDNATWTDIGWLQYVNATFTQPTFSDFYGTNWFPEYPSPFELAVASGWDMTVDETKNVLDGPYGILDVNNFQDFMAQAQALAPLDKWGITGAQGGALVGYVMDLDMLMNYAIPTIQPFIDAGSGLFTTQPVDYWLWRCLDPLVAFIAGPANASCVLQFNHTAQPRSQIWTGKDDEKKINQYVKWREQSVIKGIYTKDVPVDGCAENGQFALRLKDGDALKVFDESLYKTITLNQVEKTTFRDIHVYKYLFNNSAFDVSDLYINKIQGFANVSTPNQGVPVFLSNWDLYDVNNKYANVSGMKPDKGNVTTLFVEPFTGNTLKADEKLQVNFYLPPAARLWFGVFVPDCSDVKIDAFFPTLKVWQKSEVADHDANKLKNQLKPLQPKFLNALRFGVVGGAVLIIVVGIVFVLRGRQLRDRHGYTNIQDGRYYN